MADIPFPVISPVPSMASGPRLSTANRTSRSMRWYLLCLLAAGPWSGGCRYLAKTDLSPAPLAPPIPLASTDPSQAQRLSTARMAMQSGDENGAMAIAYSSGGKEGYSVPNAKLSKPSPHTLRRSKGNQRRGGVAWCVNIHRAEHARHDWSRRGRHNREPHIVVMHAGKL